MKTTDNIDEENNTTVTVERRGQKEYLFFKEDYINESNAFTKYFEAIKKNGYVNKIIREVDNMKDFCDLYKDVSKDYRNEQLNLFHDPMPLHDRNHNLLYASDLIKYEEIKSRGRLLIAKKGIPKSKTLISEYPTVLQVTPLCKCVGDKQASVYRCHHCGMACRLFYTCDKCNVCIFCSRSCLSLSYRTYHRYECYGLQRHFWSMADTDYSYLSLRMMFYGAAHNFESEPDHFIYGDYENNYPFIYCLETNFDKLSLTKLNQILYSSARNLIYLIMKTAFFEQFKNGKYQLEDLYLYIGGLMVKHYCQAQVNNILLNYPNLAAGYGLNVTGGTGKAICPTIALLNHSCSPNAVIVICSDFIVVKSVRPIRKGEEITICYSEVNALLSVKERQIVTEEIFNFTCQCRFCEFERDLDDAPYKCPRCINGNAKEIELKDEKHKGYCLKCNYKFSLEKHYQNLKIASICRNLYKETYALDHLTRIAECYSIIFPNKSLYLLDVYRILHEKHIHWGEQPLEAIKYGLLIFNIIEHCIPRLYVPLLVSKVNFLQVTVEMKNFFNIKTASNDEFETVRILVQEVMKVKNDLLFYLPSERLQFFAQIQKKICSMFEKLQGNEEKKNVSREVYM